MNSKMYSVAELATLIKKGRSFLIAGDEELLKKLPTGNWIAGTIPYFVADEGGIIDKERIFATELPGYATQTNVTMYDTKTVKKVYSEAPENGFSFIIIPATSAVHLQFATDAPTFPNFAQRPLIGWISGVHLSDLGKITPKVMNGNTGELTADKAIVMHISLPNNKVTDLGILNIFEQGAGDTLEFPETGFSTKNVIVNGREINFAKYIQEKKVDTKLPIVANYFGANVNISFQSIDEATSTVNFYAPVFKGQKYKLAKPFSNYVAEFGSRMPNCEQIFFSCNCILNFLYSELEGKKTGGITGPITFGEVAYQLLNQTLVYINIYDV